MYYPSNKIITDQYTPGNQFAYISNPTVEYKGYYYTLSNNNSYSGKNPNDGTPIQLVTYQPVTPNRDSDPVLNPAYFGAVPIGGVNPPTTQDYLRGDFIRYFSKKRNQLYYVEVNSDVYDKRSTPPYASFYEVFPLRWVLTGDINKVYETNKKLTLLVEQKYKAYNLGAYLKFDYTFYYASPTTKTSQYTPSNNQYTPGNELITVIGDNYVGYYHVDVYLGAQSGAFPSQQAEQLYPLNDNVLPKSLTIL